MAGQHYGGWRQRLEEVYFAGVGGGNAKLEEDELEWLHNLQLSWKQLFGGEPPLSSSSSTHLSSATFTRKGKGKARASDHAEGQPSFDDRPIEEQLCAAMLEAVLEVRKERRDEPYLDFIHGLKTLYLLLVAPAMQAAYD